MQFGAPLRLDTSRAHAPSADTFSLLSSACCLFTARFCNCFPPRPHRSAGSPFLSLRAGLRSQLRKPAGMPAAPPEAAPATGIAQAEDYIYIYIYIFTYRYTHTYNTYLSISLSLYIYIYMSIHMYTHAARELVRLVPPPRVSMPRSVESRALWRSSDS